MDLIWVKNFKIAKEKARISFPTNQNGKWHPQQESGKSAVGCNFNSTTWSNQWFKDTVTEDLENTLRQIKVNYNKTYGCRKISAMMEIYSCKHFS